jgi:hypothetical protein
MVERDTKKGTLVTVVLAASLAFLQDLSLILKLFHNVMHIS